MPNTTAIPHKDISKMLKDNPQVMFIIYDDGENLVIVPSPYILPEQRGAIVKQMSNFETSGTAIFKEVDQEATS